MTSHTQFALLLFLGLCTLTSGQLRYNHIRVGEDSLMEISIQKDSTSMTVGFEGQQTHKDYLFCNFQECKCQEMTSEQGQHPQPAVNTQILSVVCQDELTITIRRTQDNQIPFIVPPHFGSQSRSVVEIPAYSDSDMTASVIVDSKFTLKWKFPDANTIEFGVIWKSKTWVSLGFGQSMSNLDIILGNVAGTTVQLIDLWSTGETTPATDGQQDATLISSTVTDTSVSFRFSRKLSTGDSKDKTLVKDTDYNWCYVSTSATTMEEHSGSQVEKFSITLSETYAKDIPATSSSQIISVVALVLMLTI